jgi:uncharacterized protein (TIGR03437 family)
MATIVTPETLLALASEVKLAAPGSTKTSSSVVIAPVAPAVFTTNGNALLVGWAIRVTSSGTVTEEMGLVANADGSYTSAPINMGAATDKVYLAFYGTGVQAAGLANVTVTVNGVNAPVLYAGNSGYVGIDQINVALPASLAGSGTVELQLTASGIAANGVQVAIQ